MAVVACPPPLRFQLLEQVILVHHLVKSDASTIENPAVPQSAIKTILTVIKHRQIFAAKRLLLEVL